MQRAAQLISILLCAALSLVAVSVTAAYPERPIRFIVPFVPGGPSDLLSRLLGQKLSESWGQPVVVDNRGSGEGIVGYELAAKAAADGYTVLLASSSGLTINPSMHRNLPYDPVRDYRPVSQVSSGAYFMVVHPAVAARSLQEFVALAKAKPGQLNFATTATSILLGMELLNHMAGIKTMAVGYKGTGQALNAILGGEVQTFFLNPLQALPHIKAGRLRALAVTDAKRNPSLPDLPPIADTYPGYAQFVWHCVMVPAKTPDPVVEKLSREIIRIFRQPDVQQRLNSVGLDAVGSTAEELAALITKETATYAALVRQVGLQPQ